jgi:hypothetical protein
MNGKDHENTQYEAWTGGRDLRHVDGASAASDSTGD